MLDDIANGDTGEIIGLATGKDGRQNLMLFGGCQDKDSMLWRFFQCFQESIECRLAQHVYFINDEDFVLTDNRRNAHLFRQ